MIRGIGRHIIDNATFRYLQFRPDEVVLTGQEDIDRLPKGPDLPSFERLEQKMLEGGLNSSTTLPSLTTTKPATIAAVVTIVIGVLVATAAVILLPEVVPLPQGLSPSEAMAATSEIRKATVQALGVLILVIGMYFTVQTIILNRQALAAATHNQIAERYMDALQLTDPSNPVSVRLGGILSLARIGRTSQHDREAVAGYLAALMQLEAEEGTRGALEKATIIRALNAIRKAGYTGLIDLSNCALVPLRGNIPLAFGPSNLNRSNAARALCQRSHLSDSTFVEACFDGADMRLSVLDALLIRNSSFVNADVSWSSFSDAVVLLSDCRGISLVGCRLTGTYFIGADLRGANLRHTELADVHFSDCLLQGAWYDSSTVWPSGFDPVSAGARSE